jgi:hypothetical protein
MLVEQIRQSAMIEEEYCMCKNKVFAVSLKSDKISTPQMHCALCNALSDP